MIIRLSYSICIVKHLCICIKGDKQLLTPLQQAIECILLSNSEVSVSNRIRLLINLSDLTVQLA